MHFEEEMQLQQRSIKTLPSSYVNLFKQTDSALFGIMSVPGPIVKFQFRLFKFPTRSGGGDNAIQIRHFA